VTDRDAPRDAEQAAATRRFVALLAVAVACAAAAFSFGFRPTNGGFLLFLLSLPTAAALFLWGIAGVFKRQGAARWRAFHLAWVGAAAIPIGGIAGGYAEPLDFRWRRRALYESLIERVERSDPAVAKGEALWFSFADEMPEDAAGDEKRPRVALLDESFRSAANWARATRLDDGTLTVVIGFGRSGPPPAHLHYVWRSDGEWRDDVYCDWWGRVDDRWFVCGDS